jgi:fibrillarin-like pre-rRNA processing protein
MENIEMEGVFKQENRIFTENPSFCKGIKVYNEKLIKYQDKELRSWNPYRSKLAAAVLNGLKLDIKVNSKVLYLGAATGTTVSHISDILKEGLIFSIENSPIAVRLLIKLSKKRKNVIPIFADANHPDRYSLMVPIVNIVYQDISQRNQAEIFIENVNRFLKENGVGIIMVKARSVDVSLKPEKVYEKICSKLKKNNLKIINKIDLKPYEKDHAAIIVTF